MKYKSGVVDHSSKYCENLLALFTIRAVLLRQICGFQVFSYMEGFGNLDDIVMIVEYNDRTKKAFVFQLKHKATRRLNKDMLLNMKGDFSLIKYEKSYEEILKNKREPNSILRDIKENDINLIIYTNMLLINDDTDLVKLKLTNDSVYNTFINTSKKINGKVYKIENGRQVKFNPQFIKQLYLYTSQMASDELENGIWQAIAQVFSDIKIESVLSFMQYISDWMYGKLGKPYPLGYKEIEMKLLEILIQPWTILPTISISADNMESSNQWSAWNKAVMVSDLTILSDNESLEFATQAALELLKSSTVWDMYVNRRIFEDLSTNSKIVKKLLLKRKRLKGELSPDHIYMTLWELKQLPLIISCPTKDSLEISIKALKLFSGTIRKFIIVHENCIIDEFEELRRLYRIFNRVTTLPSKVALNILSKIQISLQGKTALSLKGLICDKISCTTFLTPDMILQMNTQTVYIGNRFPDSDFHIQRRFKKIFMLTQVINEHNLIFIVYVKAKAATCITDLLNEKHYMDIDDYLVNMTNSYNHHGLADINVLFLRENQRKYLFSLAKHVYQLNMDKSVCLLEYLEDMDVFKCLDTVGSIKMQDIKKHIVENVEGDEKYSVSESDALNYFESPLQILRGTAGSGKTTTLKYISNNSSPYSWVFYIDLMLQHHEFAHMDPESSDISILMSLLKLETSFSQNVFKMLLEQGKVIFFIDDFDFIQTNVKLKEVVNFLIELCTSYGNKIWISSRTEDVENSFNKIAIELELLNEPNQIEFLEKHIGSKYPTEMYKEVVKKMKRNLGTNLSGIIFQWKWLVEILKNKDLRSFIRNDDLIIDIFKEIIELNCNFYPTNKESNKIMMYKLALSVVFQDDILREIIDLDEFLRLKQCFIEDIKTTCKQFIITSFKDDGEPVFVDKLYFEYLIAYWLAQNIKRDTIKHLVNKLFYFELANIKYWFDLILSRDHAVHKAVVTLDLVGLKQIFEDHVGHEMSVLTQSDICGRNALHLAANNGVHFDFMTKQDIVGIKNVNKHCKAFRFDIYTDLSIPEKRDYGKGGCGEQILTFLLQKLPSEDHKILFKTDKVGLSVFDHAYKSGSLFILNELLNYGFYRVLCQDQNVFFLHHCYNNGLFNIIRNASFQCFCSVRVGRKLLADELERSEVVLGCLKKCCESRLCSKINKQDSSHSFDDTKNMDDMKDMHSKFLEASFE